MRCSDCDFYEPFYNENDEIQRTGQCRRYAPHPKEYAEGPGVKTVVPSWPVLDAEEWCGEFAERRVR